MSKLTPQEIAQCKRLSEPTDVWLNRVNVSVNDANKMYRVISCRVNTDPRDLPHCELTYEDGKTELRLTTNDGTITSAVYNKDIPTYNVSKVTGGGIKEDGEKADISQVQEALQNLAQANDLTLHVEKGNESN